MLIFIIAGCSLQGVPTGSKDKNEDPMSIVSDPRCQGNGIRPLVTYTINSNGATNVFINTKIGVFFTKEMNPRTINESTFILKQGKRQVKGRVTYNGLGAVLTPYHELTPFVTYTARITKKVRDLTGNSLVRDYVWSWTTGSGLDKTLPSIIHTVNPDGATDVFINTKITATFNKVMDVSTISESTASFKQGSMQVPGRWFYTGLSLVFIPAVNLAPNTQYTGTVTTGVKDLAGNPLSRNFVVSWTTGSRLNTSIPYILYKTPTITRSISHGVLTVSATFSEPMDPLTVTTLNFMLKQGTTPVAGTVLYNDQTLTASFIPTVDLTPNTTYTATITTGVQNIAGIPLASDDVWSFTTSPAVGQVQVNLGTADNFAILAGSTITNTGLTIVNGDIGLNPGISVTGFPPGILNGTLHLSDPTVITAKLDLLTAFNDAAGRTGPNLVSSELGGTTLTPGLYNSAAGTFAITGILTLDAQGTADAVFIFQAASTLVTAGNSSIVLINGAQAKNIFWQVGSSATLGIDSVIKGNIMAQASITVSSGVTIDGRALALTAAVTLDTNTITKPTP